MADMAAQAEQRFQSMEEADVQPTVAIYKCVITACAQKGEVEQAEQWLQCMEKAYVQPNLASYRYVISL